LDSENALKSKSKNDFSADLAHLIGWLTDEPILFLKMQKWLDPSPPDLASTEDEKEHLEKRLEKLVQRLGAPPGIIIQLAGDETKEVFDEYGASALQEVFSYYQRCRKSLLRSHLLFTSVSIYTDRKDIWKNPPNDEEHKALVRFFTDRLWEEIETC
jgi:hypothetical protein